MVLTHSALISGLNERFPELKDELADECWAGLLHLEVSCFARLTQMAIDDGDRDLLKRCFDFARTTFHNADDEVKNAMYVSYLEHLNFSDSKKTRRSWAFVLMLPALQQGYRDIMKYLEDLPKKASARPDT
jgi:hypothetical protein